MTGLTYLMPSWWPWAAGCLLIAIAISGWLFIRRPHPFFSRNVRIGLWSLRVISALLILFCVLDWRQETVRSTREKPLLRALLDKSASMATRDMAGRSRYETAREVLTKKIQPPWDDSARVETGFAGNGFSQGDPATTLPDATRSALGGSLRETLESQNQQALGGVILLTDGAAADLAELRATAKLYHDARVPVFPWIIGTKDQPDDLRILSASLRQPSPSQATLHLELVLESPGYAGQQSTLTVRFGDQMLHQQLVRLGGGRQTLGIDFLSPYRGCHFYEVSLSPMEGEGSTANNVTRVACDVHREPIRVLYMEGSEPGETTYLRDAIEADPDMEITCLHYPQDSPERAAAIRGQDTRVFQDHKGRPVPSVCHATRGFPATMENLLKYDVVINSDIYKECFSPEQLKQTVAFVEEFGGGFVMVGGQTSFGSGGYEKTVIDKLMPIEISDHSDPFWQHFQPKVSEAGFSHPIMLVGKDAEETRSAWNQRFPGFGGSNTARRAKPGAHVLARVNCPGTRYDDLVLFAVQQIGRGRTMAFMTDTTTSWGTNFERDWGTGGNAVYYRKFWNNIVRWLAADRIARKGGQAVIDVPHETVIPGDTVTVRLAALSTADFAGLEVTVRQGDEEPRPLPVQWNGATRHWEGPVTPRAAGEVTIDAHYKNTEGLPVITSAGFYVRGESDEAVAVATRPDLMQELARATGGTVLDDSNVAGILGDISSRSVPVVWKRAIPIWDRWWILLPLLAAISAEWLLRRRREPAHK